MAKTFYAKSQFAATSIAAPCLHGFCCIGICCRCHNLEGGIGVMCAKAFGTPSLSFCSVLAIELASLLMTLVRKGLIEAGL